MPTLINEVKVHVPGDGIPSGDVVEKTDNKKKEKIGKFPRSCFIKLNKLPRNPGTLHCSNCQMPIRKTVKDPIATGQTHFVAALMTPILLTWLPYVTKFSRNIVHRCPFCRVQLGVTVFRIIGKDKDCIPDYEKPVPEQPNAKGIRTLLVQTKSIMYNESTRTIPLSHSGSMIIKDEKHASIPSVQLHKKQLTDRNSLAGSKGSAAEGHPKTASRKSSGTEVRSVRSKLSTSSQYRDGFPSEKLISHLEAKVQEINSASATFFEKVGSVAESEVEHVMFTKALGTDEVQSFHDKDLKAKTDSEKTEEQVKSEVLLNPEEQRKPEIHSLLVPPNIATKKPCTAKTCKKRGHVPRKRSGMALSKNEEAPSVTNKEKPVYRIPPPLARTRDGKIAETRERKSSVEPVAGTSANKRMEHLHKCKQCKKFKKPKFDEDEDRKDHLT